MDGSRIILAAHRGEKKHHPENTMVAFKEAHRLGIEMIETDIRMTADGELVIMHDRSGLRTCGVDCIINDMTLEEVKKLDAGSTFDPKFAGEAVPTVREFLEWIAPTGMMVNWELKDYPCDVGDERAFECIDKLIAMIREFDMVKRSMLNSFSDRVLEHAVKQIGHEILIHGQGINKARRSKDDPEMDEVDLFDWCCVYPQEAGHLAIDYPEDFDYCLDHSILPCILLPDTIENYKRCIELGVRMFTTNDCEAADKVLRELGERE